MNAHTPGASRLMSKWTGLLATAVLIVLMAWGAVIRFRLDPVALSEWDSWGWLHPAIAWLGGGGFQETCEREWLYGAFAAVVLRLTGSMTGLVLIQQILGLAAAGVMWLTWRRWVAFFPRHPLFEAGTALLGLGAIAIYLLNPIVLLLELSVRPEALLAFTAFLQLFCILSFCKYRWQTPHAAAAIIYGALSLPLAWALYVLKPNWALAVPATTLPVFIGLLGGPFPFLTRALPVIIGFVLAFLTLWLPDKALFIRTSETRVVLPMTLFTIHADIIQNRFAEEFEASGTDPKRREFLASVRPVLDREMDLARAEKSPYKRLGFDPDYLMYRSTIFPYLMKEHGMSMPEVTAFCRKSFLDALWHRPFDYAGKVLRQMDYFFRPDDSTFFRKRVEIAPLHAHSLEILPKSLPPTYNPASKELYDRYLNSVERATGGTDTVAVRPGIRNFLRHAKAYAPVLLIGLVCCVVLCLSWKPLAFLRLPGLTALLILGAPAGNALTVAMVHALDNGRYRGSYGSLYVFALAAALVFCAAVVGASGKLLFSGRLQALMRK